MDLLVDKYNTKKRKYIILFIIIIAIVVLSYVLFKKPMPGVADQGDFDRVMCESGLELLPEYISDNTFNRFYDYTISDYKITGFDSLKLYNIIGKSTLSYLILIINSICKLLDSEIFKTNYLAIVYSFIYLISFTIILKFNNIKGNIKLLIMGLLGILIFFDGNYLVWFNSLYGEPMMITSLMLFISSYMYYTYKKFIASDEEGLVRRLIFLFLSAFLFLGSKMQVFTVLPFVLILLIKTLLENIKILRKSIFIGFTMLLLFISIYPIIINKTNCSISKDTQYNSVFYGILKDSEDPRKDLIDMGLNPDMAVEAGKHAYLSPNEYIKYIPRTEITEEEFYKNINNIKLVKFYLAHPTRFFYGMQNTAKDAFKTSTFLGKYSREYSEEPIREFNRFTIWSSIREMLPKSFLFIVIIYLLIIIYSFIIYLNNKNNLYLRRNIEFLWMIISIGITQYPMPFVGNGYADIAKQLYLFNFVFDIIIYIELSYILCKILSFLYNKK